jgi:hypothetical protein
MHYARLVTTGLLSFGLLTSLPAMARARGMLPPEQTQGPVTYVSGGIGADETRAFAAAAKQYPLTLEFAIKHAPHTEFAANVHVTITDAKGQSVLDTRSDGPFLLAKLPVGYYTVRAEQQEQMLTRSVHVMTHKPAHVLFLWVAKG